MNQETLLHTNVDFNSNHEGLSKLEYFVQSILDELKVDPAHHGNIQVALSEAGNNAVKHGNKGDENKSFNVRYEVEGRDLVFYVQDQGSGFDYNNIPDPTAPENIEKESGRGVFLIKHLSDGYEFSNNGSCLKISFFVL